jgi:hypothetical protein
LVVTHVVAILRFCRRNGSLFVYCSVVARPIMLSPPSLRFTSFVLVPRSLLPFDCSLRIQNWFYFLCSTVVSTSFLFAFRSRRVSVPSFGHIQDTPPPIGIHCDVFLIWEFGFSSFRCTGAVLSFSRTIKGQLCKKRGSRCGGGFGCHDYNRSYSQYWDYLG